MEQPLSYPLRRNNAIPNSILGMLFLLTTEAMFFGGLISAYIINRAGTAIWPPEGQPRLGIEITAFNTLLLLTSAFTVFLVNKSLDAGNMKKSKKLMIVSIVLGTLFVAIQGSEWVKLLDFGLTTRSGLYGAFFYTIIGSHALHVLAGICLLLYARLSLKSKKTVEISATTRACSLYWYFVAGIWPVLYYLVYLY